MFLLRIRWYPGSSAICSALVEAGHAGCCFHGSSDTEQQAFERALFIIAKNVAISKHFYHAAPAGRHGTALCKAACTTRGGPAVRARDAVWPGRHTLPPAASFPAPPGRPCGFPGREDMRKNTPRHPPASTVMPLSPPLRRARMVRASQTGAPIGIRTPPGNATGAGAYLPAPVFCGIGKSPEPKPRADPARSPHARMQQPF